MLILRLLLCQLGRALALEQEIVAGVFFDGLLFDMQDLVDDGIEEIAVMRDQQQHTRVAFQPALQPDHCIEIQVVSRFIKQQ